MEYIKRLNVKKRTYTSDFSAPRSDYSGHVFRKGLSSTVTVCSSQLSSAEAVAQERLTQLLQKAWYPITSVAYQIFLSLA